MAITYAFTNNAVCTTDDVAGYDDVVSCVHWQYVFTDGEFDSVHHGVTRFVTDAGTFTIDADTFISANSVTTSDIESWVRATDLPDPAFADILEYHTGVIEGMRGYPTEYLLYTDRTKTNIQMGMDTLHSVHNNKAIRAKGATPDPSTSGGA